MLLKKNQITVTRLLPNTAVHMIYEKLSGLLNQRVETMIMNFPKLMHLHILHFGETYQKN